MAMHRAVNPVPLRGLDQGSTPWLPTTPFCYPTHMPSLSDLFRALTSPDPDIRKHILSRSSPTSTPLITEYQNSSLPSNVGAYTYQPLGTTTVEIDYNTPLLDQHPTLKQSVKNHERIHAYQKYLHESPLGMMVPPSPDLKSKIFTDTTFSTPIPGDPAAEIPAYALMEDKPSKMRGDFARYVNDGYKRSGGKTSAIETLLPPALHEDYIKTSPRPLLPPDSQMKEMSFWDLVRGNKR